MWSPFPQISSPGCPWPVRPSMLCFWCQLGIGQGEAGRGWRSGHLRFYLPVRHRRSMSKESPPVYPFFIQSPPFLFKTSNWKTQLHSDVKTLEFHFWLQPTQKGLWPIRLLPVSKGKTITISGLMHICHARRIGGPDGHDTVAGASTNVCACPCCYLYHGETQTRKYLQEDTGPFWLGVKVISKINRWD